ncbi:MAG: flagellar motor protein MotB [Puniceicoccaceae bacterium]|nr:MAG: flagellar motor protein MotB [Puniceicoccaceae bacterium]
MGKKGEHHGGSWKVAYADFATAMMALFMVLWISAQDDEILIATARYFQSPFNFSVDASLGVMSFDGGSDLFNNETGDSNPSLSNLNLLHTIAQEFYSALDLDLGDRDRPVDVQVAPDGLRVILFDRSRHPLFRPGTAEFTEWGRFVVQNMAWLIERYGFKVRIGGHLAAGFVSADPAYTGWELSTDRANAARRALEHYAVDPRLIDQVTGYADNHPLPGTDPGDPSNQRLSISLVITAPLTPLP